ncbi:probable serine/threonine-protein kinase nek3 [Copidosoma floridanum]|uniref:probable serine/threonine-protein kinase nek3 n=1 Tax=Copidosoma floridanum TaxID=29053 RepID=UPI0006C99047|nr:probable serine/threonine-protein kinase nek3 [Copidosoma floridanum]
MRERRSERETKLTRKEADENMSANSHQLEAACTAKVKKERSPTPTPPASCSVQQQQPATRLHQRSVSAQPPPPPSSGFSNGHFHSRDLLQDVLKGSKFNNLSHLTPAAKHEAVRLMVEDSISEESRYRVQEVFSQVEQMKVEEKLLLYLKLSVSLTNPNGAVDPLRQPLNPLGNRYEIHQTIMWIKTHLEEDPDVSLPKQEVYDEYNIFCANNSMKPLSTADFGKVMKQVYPRVRPRRLGTRGNSRYCYSGMRKRIKLDPPTLPSMSDVDVDEDFEQNLTEEMLGAASTLIREWAESLLDIKFSTLCSLGKYLVNNLCVDNRSLAAVCLLSASGETQPVTNKGTSPGLPAMAGLAKNGKLREAQLQLQRKLQQREQIRDHKDQPVNSTLPVNNKEKTVDQNDENIEAEVKKGKRGKVTNVNHLVQGTNNVLSKANNNNYNYNNSNNNNNNAPVSAAVTPISRQKKLVNKSNNQPCSGSSVLQSNCDNLVVQSIQANEQISSAQPRLVRSNSAQSPREVKPRNARKRAGSSVAASVAATVTTASMTSESSPEKQLKLTDMLDSTARSTPRLSSTPIHHKQQQQQHQHSTKIPVILDSNPKTDKSNNTSDKPIFAAALVNQPPKSCDKDSFLSFNSDCSKSNGHTKNSTGKSSQKLIEDQMQLLSDVNSCDAFKTKLGNIDTDTLNDYLNGGNNSQEQEEELLQYFQPSNSSSSDMELSNVVSETETSSRQDQVSQLRIILQENLQDSVLGVGGKPRLQSAPVDKQQALQKHNLILPTLLNAHGNAVNTRRRVSFETNAVECSQDSGNGTSTAGSSCSTSNTVPQSPNTRRRIFNFTPISPGPHSPINGLVSKSNSANASPFVSPRNTPVPRSRSNLQGNCRSRSSQKTLARSISCNVRSDNFIVPICTPEMNGINRPPHSPLAPLINNKASQATMPPVHSPLLEQTCKAQTLPCTPLLSDLVTQEDQLLINYPSQENLQEIKNVYNRKPQPTDQEISDLLQSKRQQEYAKDQLFYRSQSVPLHRMVNPALLSPISVAQQMTPNFQYHSFNPSTNSSIAPTPVPSEFNDFSSICGPCDNSSYLLDPLVSSADPDFLIEDKEMTPENLNNIFDILNEAEPQHILSDEGPSVDKDQTIGSSSLMMDSLGNANLSDNLLLVDNSGLLDSWTNDNGLSSSSSSGTGLAAAAPKLLHSRSYPNTPLPLPSSSSSSLVVQYLDDSNGSHSYPTTPLNNSSQHQQQDPYAESNEPMLFNSSLNAQSLGLPNHQSTAGVSGNGCCSTSVECSVADFLEQPLDDETDDLGSLRNFDGLQDVDALSPLFNEVVEPNH